ncbi:methyl-accepting chemotaxis protein [Paenibacillus sp. V4I3]|uniref:hypothetical protein n=1 Tax=Paenibacillus sp. V4I3 TaxID=3042305 RepID=UPI00277F8E05|nr:hypothetical protein [Paenibacillus sp. V4I3]MDQ0876083.1 methyl-accepting chemotaxis protein [Paenibacillus sp. V4I3]
MTGLVRSVSDVMRNKVSIEVEKGILVTEEAREAFTEIKLGSMDSFQHVTAASQEQIASMEEMNSTSIVLFKMAENMHHVVERFKLK